MRKTIFIAVAAACAISPVANATNGIFLIGAGNISRGMGGVAIGDSVDSLSAYANPAAIAGMKPRFDGGGDLFIPTSSGRLGSVSSDSENDEYGIDNVYPMPSMGYVAASKGQFTWGIHAVPVGGGATVYKTNFFQAAAAGTSDPALAPKINDELGVNLLVMQVTPTIAWQTKDKVNSVGFSLITSLGRFSADGLELFDPFTQSSGTSKDFSGQGKDHTFGVGARIGWLGNYGDWKVGMSYTSKVNMDNYNRYEELFAESGDMDIPAIAGLGFSYKISPKMKFAADITKTFYKGVRSISNLGPNLAGDPSGSLDPATQQLGMKEGLGFGYSNQVVTKLGLEYLASEKLTLRTGWNYGKSPINEDREIIFNLLAPASTQNHFTLGASYQLSKNKDLNFSYIHAFEHEQSGPTYVSDDGSNFGSFKMYQNSFGMSVSMRF